MSRHKTRGGGRRGTKPVTRVRNMTQYEYGKFIRTLENKVAGGRAVNREEMMNIKLNHGLHKASVGLTNKLKKSYRKMFTRTYGKKIEPEKESKPINQNIHDPDKIIEEEIHEKPLPNRIDKNPEFQQQNHLDRLGFMNIEEMRGMVGEDIIGYRKGLATPLNYVNYDQSNIDKKASDVLYNLSGFMGPEGSEGLIYDHMEKQDWKYNGYKYQNYNNKQSSIQGTAPEYDHFLDSREPIFHQFSTKTNRIQSNIFSFSFS